MIRKTKDAKDKKNDKVSKQDKKGKKDVMDKQGNSEPKKAEPKASQRQTSLFGRASKP